MTAQHAPFKDFVRTSNLVASAPMPVNGFKVIGEFHGLVGWSKDVQVCEALTFQYRGRTYPAARVKGDGAVWQVRGLKPFKTPVNA